jgi:SAM-dependent methyltransferase
MSEQPRPTAGTVPILDRALDMLCDVMPEPGHLADLPCGTGYLSFGAVERGWKVSPLDLNPEGWEGGDIAVPRRVDLNERLPLPDEVFDAIACCEGLEHIENPWLVLREFARVLRPGGVLVVTLPNTIDLRQRWRILRRGYYGHYLPKVPDHINLLGTFGLCHALLRQGFRIEAIDVAKVYGGPLRRVLARLVPFSKASRLPDEVRRMLSQPRVLCGRTAVIAARLA